MYLKKGGAVLEDNLEIEKYGKNTISRLSSTLVPNRSVISRTPSEIISSWNGNIHLHEETETDKGLRGPQLGACYAVLAHWTVSSEIATVVIPTGVGKTETMLSLLVTERCKKLLVTVPSNALRKQLGDKFVQLGLLRELKIINNTVENPIVGILSESFKDAEDLYSFIDKCNVVVTTVSLLAKQEDETLTTLAKKFSHYFIDEAHHTAAATWDKLRERFKKTDAKIVQFTATPFREDGKRITGKVVYNFPLRTAQEQGYFSKIDFKAITALTTEAADRLIAEKAIEVLNERFNQGFPNQIIMARAGSTDRANKLIEIYRTLAPELNPIVIHTRLKSQEITTNTQMLQAGKTHIVVCVDMFGEGFDQPNFKIAALHDPKKGLAVTLQFIGRFTRVGNGKLGPATFVANTFDNDFKDSISQLYNEDSDWNKIIPSISFEAIGKELEFEEIASNFTGDDLYQVVSVESLNPAYSTAVYKNQNSQWNPDLTVEDFNLEEEDSLHILSNSDRDIIIAIVVKKLQAKWTTSKACNDINYELFIFYNDKENSLLFINSSKNEGYYKEIAQKLLNNPNPDKINGEDCFKVFHGIKRLTLNNVGLKLLIGRSTRYRMSIGSDVSDAISTSERQNSTKSLIAGSGYKNGEKYTIGVSCKGRIWSIMRGNIAKQIVWFKEIGKILSDPTISSSDILKDTLIPKDIVTLPTENIFDVDWCEETYDYQTETAITISFDDKHVPLLYTDLSVLNVDASKSEISFRISYDDGTSNESFSVDCILKLTLNSDKHPISQYSILSASSDAQIFIGKKKKLSLIEYLQEYEPTFFFVDGSQLTGTKYVKAKTELGLYDTGKLVSRNWENVDLSKESMWDGNILLKNSIQYSIVEELKVSSKYSIIINDDGSGEMADIIAIMPPSKEEGNESIDIELYHLKYAANGKPSRQIKNLYEVCGQAQKSSRWKHKCNSDPSVLFNHIKKREELFKKKHPDDSRVVYGKAEDLSNLKRYSKSLKYNFKVFIVQPGIDTSNITDEMRAVLSCTENYLDEVACIPLVVIGS